jgi:ferritin-like metal-binding protein YciE
MHTTAPGEATMAASNLEDIFLMTLKDMYHGEKQIVKALPKMAKHAESPQLKEALNHHLEETKGQVGRLERVFQLMDKPARGETCEAIKGLIEEGEELMEKADNGAVCDAGMIGVSQAIEHYEMARYGTLISWRKPLIRKRRPTRSSTISPSTRSTARPPSTAAGAGDAPQSRRS